MRKIWDLSQLEKQHTFSTLLYLACCPTVERPMLFFNLSWVDEAYKLGHPGAVYLKKFLRADKLFRAEIVSHVYECVCLMPNDEGGWNLFFRALCLRYNSRNTTEATRLFQQSADQGNVCAHIELCSYYFIRGDREQQKQHAIAASDKGYCVAHYERYQLSGKKAFPYLLLAAKQGVSDAYRDLSTAYRLGKGVDADTYEAIRWQTKPYPNVMNDEAPFKGCLPETVATVFFQCQHGDFSNLYRLMTCISDPKYYDMNKKMRTMHWTFKKWIDTTQRATLCWMWVHKTCRLSAYFPRDIALKIAQYVWESRKHPQLIR